MPLAARLAVIFAILVACRSSASGTDKAVAKATPPPLPPIQATSPDTDRADPRLTRTLGSATAPVTVYEMSDFQCPFCRRHVLETMPVLVREYVETGKVRWVFINFPIPELHPNAVPAAEVAMCAARQERFWRMHDLIFRHQRSWEKLDNPGPFLLSLTDSVGMDREQTLACLRDPAIARAVRLEAEGAIRAGANSTPTFYIEGGLLVGAHPVEVFRPILDSIIGVRQRQAADKN